MYKPWDIRHIDLSENLIDLAADRDIQGIYLVFWWKDVALGELQIEEGQLPVPARQLAEMAVQAITPAVGDHLFERGFEAPLPVKSPRPASPPALGALMRLEKPLEQLHAKIASSSEQPPDDARISVIICTRDRPRPLRQCLEAIRHLSEKPHEVIVVDNAPRSDETRQIVKQQPDVRYVHEPQPGLSKARNAGIRRATGDIIAFTDDDVIVHSRWTARLKQALSRPDVLAATGLILPAELETEAQYLFQQGHGDFGWGYRSLTFDAEFLSDTKSRGAPVWHIGAGANMAFRREAFERVGLFDERLGAGAAGCSEDSEMWYRILAAGKRCRYEPTAVVHHRHRVDLDALNDQMYYYMRGHQAALLAQAERYGHWGNLYRAFGILPAYYARLLMRRIKHKRSPTDTLAAQIQGCAAGPAYYMQHRNGATRSTPRPHAND